MTTSATVRTTYRVAGLCLRLVLVALVVASLAVALGPLTGRYRTLTVVSGSMEPALPTGSVLLYTSVASNAVRAGDIITFHPPGSTELVTHRATAVATDAAGTTHVTTKGDANNGDDPWDLTLTSTNVWKVRGHIEAIGYPLVWLRGTAPIKAASIVLPVLLGLSFLIRIWSDDEERCDPATA